MHSWIIAQRRLFHQHPELGYCENWTSAEIKKILANIGWKISDPIAQTGFVATLPGTNDHDHAIAWRTDIDALPIHEQTQLPFASLNPNCMHACGHDAHIAVALGIARILFENKEKLYRDIHIVFQPNEEGAPGELPTGAKQMCLEHLLSRFHIAQMLALHCSPELDAGTLGIKPNAVWAANARFSVEISGKSSHAAYPHRGIDALWSATEMVHAIYAAKSRLKSAQDVISICKISSGTAFNVLADFALFEGTLRAESTDRLHELNALIQKCVHGVDEYTQTRSKTEFFPGAASVQNDPALTQRVEEILRTQGIAEVCSVNMRMASEDFSYFSQTIPSCYLMMGIHPKSQDKASAPLHSPLFDIDESCLLVAAQAMANVLLELASY